MGRCEKYRIYETTGTTEVFEIVAENESEAKSIVAFNRKALKVYDEPYFKQDIEKVAPEEQ